MRTTAAHHRSSPPRRPTIAVVLGAALALLALTGGAARAAAAVEAPGWRAGSHSYPTDLVRGENATVAIDVYNIGATASTEPATVTDTLPAGIVGISSEGWACSASTPQTCTHQLGETPEYVAAGTSEEIALQVEVQAGATEGTFANLVEVSGGGASGSVSNSSMLTIGGGQAGFGFAQADAWFSSADGALDTQAGSHPYALTFAFALNANGEVKPAGKEEARDVTVNLPAGLIGDQRAAARCTREQFDTEECPVSTQVGVATIRIALGGPHPLAIPFPLYNLLPPPGNPAQFGFDFNGIHAFFDASVRSGSDYGITVHVGDLPQVSVLGGSIAIWGVPGEASHDAQRCGEVDGAHHCDVASGAATAPFLTLPTACPGADEALSFSVAADSWRAAVSSTSFPTRDAAGSPSGLTGCERLDFAPAISIAPDTAAADTPAGLITGVRNPEPGLLDPEGLATADMRAATLTLPEGLLIDPAAAAGLQACGLANDGIGSEQAPSCPPASKLGTIEAETPVLEEALRGNVYLLQSDPPDIELLLDAAGDGVEVKLIAHVTLDETTGRLTTTLSELPQAPITDFKLTFSGGPQAALMTPTGCGVYETSADFTPWGSPAVADARPSSAFTIASGSNGAPCPPTPLPFTPTILAGSTNDQAGGFTDFTFALSRPDDQQRMSSFQLALPPGLLGMVSTVPLCGEPQASLGDCPADSQIGNAGSQAGAGPDPLLVPEPGRAPAPIYLTGPYKGAPYGVSVAVPISVGPFELGTIVVRGTVHVNRTTAAITIASDPLPAIVDGVQPDLRTIDSVINRPGFMFNPTDCAPLTLTGSVTSTQGTTAPVANRFQVGSCRALPFEPRFSVSTAGHTSRADGASLDATLTYPTATGANQASSQANLARVKVSLPKQLPARLTTLQKSCPASTFNANPANCSAASVIGTVRALTPVLPGELTGPAYFVSNGGAKFPELVVILSTGQTQVEVRGQTFINPSGITTATFASVPDAPLSRFELDMPQGPDSALAANGNLCESKLVMPTEFVGQNGAVIHQSTPIHVSGCPKPKTRRKKATRRVRHKRHG